MTAETRRDRFRALHARDHAFVMPNPWDLGSVRLLESLGFEALATTSAGMAWSLGKLDYAVTRDDLVAHVEVVAAGTDLPINVDSQGCYPHDPGGVSETVRLLAAAGAAGCSIEDYDVSVGGVIDQGLAVERVAEAVAAAHAGDDPMVLTARAEQFLYGSTDLDEVIARLIAYRDAGADVVYAPGLSDLKQIATVVEAVGVAVNVLALPKGPSVPELSDAGVKRVSTGGALARAAYGALVAGARELLETGTSTYVMRGMSRADEKAAFDRG